MALAGIKVLELAGLAPVPFAGMVLADFGAKVTRIDKLQGFQPDTMGRGKRSIAVNLKLKEGQSVVRRLSAKSDVIIEPFRPGVMESLKLGPDLLLKENPKLVYVRLSGYGQSGPYKMRAGHDINYISASGVLSMLKRTGQKPQAPVNLIADFGGGGLMAAFGVITALFERERSGKGQIIDANMLEGSAYLSSFFYLGRILFTRPPGENLLDTGAPFYDTYETKDGKFISVGALEPKFFFQLVEGFNLDKKFIPNQLNPEYWPELRSLLTEKFGSLTREEITHLFEKSDACVMPVLGHDEVAHDAHNKSRSSFFKDDEGRHVPIPAPRLSRTPASPSKQQPRVGAHTREVLLENGFTKSEVSDLLKQNAVHQEDVSSRL